MKHIKRNSIVILIISTILLMYIMKDNYKAVTNLIIDSNKLFLFLAIIFYSISFLIDSYSFCLIIRQYSNNFSFKKAIKLNIMTKFFNGITPLSTGGQPFQLYELHKEKVKLSDSTNIVIQFYIIFQIALVFLSTTAIILNKIFHIFVKNEILRNLVVIGYLINLIILLVLFFISFNKKFNKKITKFIINFLSKIKIIKNKEKTHEKWNQACDNFYQSAQILKKEPKTLIIGVFLQICQLLILYTVPLFIIHATKLTASLNLFNTLIASSYIFLVGCYIPIPGGTGGMEFGFLGFFGNFVLKNAIKAATILWRFVTYYVPVIIGGIIFNIKNTKKNAK